MTHDGKRCERRGRRAQTTRSPKVYYYIITDGECTEENYCRGLFSSLSEDRKKAVTLRDIIHVQKPRNFIARARELKNNSAPFETKIWFVFDCDKVPNFDKIISEANAEGLNAAWSNPCIEEWFWMYFDSSKTHTSSTIANSEFRTLYKNKTGLKYDKNDKEIYRRLNSNGGDEKEAVIRAENQIRQYQSNNVMQPSQMYSSTIVHAMVQEIRGDDE